MSVQLTPKNLEMKKNENNDNCDNIPSPGLSSLMVTE